MEVLHGTINTNKEPLFLRVFRSSELSQRPYVYCFLERNMSLPNPFQFKRSALLVHLGERTLAHMFTIKVQGSFIRHILNYTGYNQ